MDRFWEDVMISIAMGLIVPALVLWFVVALTPDAAELPAQTEPVLQAETVPTEPEKPCIHVKILTEDETVIEMELNDYLTCVVLAEMPVSFDDEALKAQSVVARTYTLRAANGKAKHKNAAVCTKPACCQSYMSVESYLGRGGKETDVARIRNLIELTSCEVLMYDGDFIEATYFSCSGGTTEDAVAVWGTDVPYLQSVESPGEEHATHYTGTVTYSTANFAAQMGMALSGEPKSWFGQTTYTEGGGVATMKIGGTEFSGTQLRKILGLRSTAFEIEVSDDTITITTRGFGHRVGMSQYGADAMAASGSTYPEILAHYYQGAELSQYTD